MKLTAFSTVSRKKRAVRPFAFVATLGFFASILFGASAFSNPEERVSKTPAPSANVVASDGGASALSERFSPNAARLKPTGGVSQTVYPGRVAAFRKSTLTFRVSGPLLEIAVVPGQTVKEGETLMQIDPRDYQIQVDAAQAKLDAAQARLEAMRNGARPEDVALLKTRFEESQASYVLAEKEYARAKKLVEKDAVSVAEFDVATQTFVLAGLARDKAKKELEKETAGARVEDIKAAEAEIRGLETALAAAKNSLDDATLRAPYDGVVAAKLIEVDEMVTTTPTFREVLVFHDVSRLKVETYVPEREMIDGDLIVGQTTVDVRFTAKRENVYRAVLAEIDTQPSQVGMAYKLTFALDAPKDLRVLPGMIAEVSMGNLQNKPNNAPMLSSASNDEKGAIR